MCICVGVLTLAYVSAVFLPVYLFDTFAVKGNVSRTEPLYFSCLKYLREKCRMEIGTQIFALVTYVNDTKHYTRWLSMHSSNVFFL